MHRTLLTTFLALIIVLNANAQQCMLAHSSMIQVFQSADRVVEGKVISKHSIVSESGSILTVNTINVNREFGVNQTEDQISVVTEGGVVGSLAQVVYPSVTLNVGSTVICSLNKSQYGLLVNRAFTFDLVDQKFPTPEGNQGTEEMYHVVMHAMQTDLVSIASKIEIPSIDNRAAAPQIVSFSPSSISAGSLEELTISGSGFGSIQGVGVVSFSNADDGGQSFVSLPPGPHYTQWSNSEIKVLVPSSMLFGNVIAGTGMVRVTNNASQAITSAQQLNINYAHGELIYEGEIGQTSLIGLINGGYELSVGATLLSLIGGQQLIQKSLDKWACNTGINFNLVENVSVDEQFGMNDVSVLGMAASGTLPANVLGKTITTLSACGGGEGLEWQLLEVDILLNPVVNWYIGNGTPPVGSYDIQTVMIHELGHAHLLQHNNNSESVMYFELYQDATRRFLDVESDMQGGSNIVARSVYDSEICSSERMDFYNDTDCDLGLVNSIEDAEGIKLFVAPNPSNGNITITGIEAGESFIISEISGRTVYTDTNNSGGSVNLNLTDLQAGVYLLRVNGGRLGNTQKLVIQ
jgi:hypothetical protein